MSTADNLARLRQLKEEKKKNSPSEGTAKTERINLHSLCSPETRDIFHKQSPAPAPAAVAVEPMTAPERTAISAWLAHIEETDPATIANTLTRCELDAGARSYFLGRARQAPQERAEQLLEEKPGLTHTYSVLFPDADPVLVGVAVRGKGSCTLAVPADRYDPFKLLELVERKNVKSMAQTQGESK